METAGTAMKAVVDTNVIAYLLLGTAPFAAAARRCFESTTERLAPAHWEAELDNVLWQPVRAGVLPPAEARPRLHLATQLGIETVPTQSLASAALVRSIASGISVYDTLFVELAQREQCPLLTFDRALLRQFPSIAASPASLQTGS